MASAKQKMKNNSHNQSVLNSLCGGDLVEIKRGVGYAHWGVYIGDEQIIHLWADEDDGLTNLETQHLFTPSGHRFDKAKIRKDSFWKVVGDDLAYKNNDKDSKWQPLTPGEIIHNALEKIGTVGYSILYENCEHFAKWCRYGIAKSDQADNVLTGLAVGIAGALAVGVVHAVSKYLGSGDNKEKKKQEIQ